MGEYGLYVIPYLRYIPSFPTNPKLYIIFPYSLLTPSKTGFFVSFLLYLLERTEALLICSQFFLQSGERCMLSGLRV